MGGEGLMWDGVVVVVVVVRGGGYSWRVFKDYKERGKGRRLSTIYGARKRERHPHPTPLHVVVVVVDLFIWSSLYKRKVLCISNCCHALMPHLDEVTIFRYICPPSI